MIKLIPWRSRVLRGPYRGNVIAGNCFNYNKMKNTTIQLTLGGDKVLETHNFGSRMM